MVYFSSNQQHLSVILQYFEAVKALVDQLTDENLDDRLAVFGEALQHIKDSSISYRSSLSEFYTIYKGQDIVLQDDPFYINMILLLLQQGSGAISDGRIFLVSNSDAILFNVRQIIESDYLKILSESHPPEALVYMRGTLFEIASVKLQDMMFATKHEAVDESFVCTPVPSDHIQLYLQVARSQVVRAAFLELDIEYTAERLDRVIEYISSYNKLYYVTMTPGNYGLTHFGYVYLNHSFSSTKGSGNVLRLLTLLHESAHMIVRIDEPAEIWSFMGSPPRSIVFKKAPKYVYINVIHFLLEIESWNKDLSEFQDKFTYLQEQGSIRRMDRILVGSSTMEGCVPGVKCWMIRLPTQSRLNKDEQDSYKRHLTFEDVCN